MEKLIEKLREAGFISKEQIKKAADRQWKSGGTLIENLVELGYLKEEDLLEFFSRVLGIHTVRLREVEIEPESVHYVPYRICATYLLIPIKRSRKTLVVAMANPLNPRAFKELSMVTDLEIVPLGAKVSEIKGAIKRFFGKDEPPLVFDTFITKPDPEKTLEAYKKEAEEAGALLDKIEEFLHSKSSALLLIGPSGAGKTFIIHAVANRVLQDMPTKGVVIVQGENLRDLLIELDETGLVPRLKEYLQNVTYLLIDEIEPLARVSRMAELIDWFLYKGGSILATSSKDLKNIDMLDRLRRRFNSFSTQYLFISVTAAEEEEQQEIETVKAKLEAVSSAVIEEKAEEVDMREYLKMIREGKVSYDKIRDILAKIRSRKGILKQALKGVIKEASEHGAVLSIEESGVGKPPNWLLDGLEAMLRKVVQSAERGDIIKLEFKKEDDDYMIRCIAKGNLLMLDNNYINKVFQNKAQSVERTSEGSFIVLTLSLNKE